MTARDTPGDDEAPADALTAEQARVLLPVLEGRRTQMDDQLWGGPALLLAAQAFLYAAAFSSGTPHWARVAVLGIGVIPLGAASHSMATKLYLERLYSEAVARSLDALGAPEIRRGFPGSLLRDDRARGWLYEGLVVRLKNYLVWQRVFWAFALADIVLAVLTFAHVR